ncbi:hypothetical protein ACO0OL_003594 [Hanseniaspora opuntiae]
MDPNNPYFSDNPNPGYNYPQNAPNAPNQRGVPTNVPPQNIHPNHPPEYLNPENPVYPQMPYQLQPVPSYSPVFYENPNINYHMQMQVQHQRSALEAKSFIKSMEFHKEQEITKQYAMKLEMLKLSMQANIPGNMIPQLFHNDQRSGSPEKAELAHPYDRVSQQDHKIKELPHPNSDVVYIDPSRSIRLRSFSGEETDDIEKTPEDTTKTNNQPENYNAIPNLQFKHQNKRTNSPFKIGEAGVKALDSNGISLNESQEIRVNTMSEVNSRVSSMHENEPILFKPKTHSFSSGILEDDRAMQSSLNSRVASVRHTNEIPEQKPFVKTHKRFNSLPSILKPSADISPSKQPTHKRARSVYFKHSKVDSQTSQTLLELSQNKAFEKPTYNMHNRKRSYDFSTHQSSSIDLDVVKRQKNTHHDFFPTSGEMEYTINKKFKFGDLIEDATPLKNNNLEETPEHETTIDEEDSTVAKKVQFHEDLIVDTDETEGNDSNNGKRKNTLESILN